MIFCFKAYTSSDVHTVIRSTTPASTVTKTRSRSHSRPPPVAKSESGPRLKAPKALKHHLSAAAWVTDSDLQLDFLQYSPFKPFPAIMVTSRRVFYRADVLTLCRCSGDPAVLLVFSTRHCGRSMRIFKRVSNHRQTCTVGLGVDCCTIPSARYYIRDSATIQCVNAMPLCPYARTV